MLNDCQILLFYSNKTLFIGIKRFSIPFQGGPYLLNIYWKRIFKNLTEMYLYAFYKMLNHFLYKTSNTEKGIISVNFCIIGRSSEHIVFLF